MSGGLILAFAACGFAILLMLSLTQGSRDETKKADISAKLIELRKSMLIVNGDSIPDKKLSVLGMVTGVSDTAASSKTGFALAEQEALYNMILDAQALGANGIISVKSSSGTYQQQGSQWQVAQVMYNGTAVQFE